MVKTFVKYEEDNYSLYNYINALSDEVSCIHLNYLSLKRWKRKKKN